VEEGEENDGREDGRDDQMWWDLVMYGEKTAEVEAKPVLILTLISM
jgi:hypothetical protein